MGYKVLPRVKVGKRIKMTSSCIVAMSIHSLLNGGSCSKWARNSCAGVDGHDCEEVHIVYSGQEEVGQNGVPRFALSKNREDDQDDECQYIYLQYSEGWIRYSSCLKWAHNSCAGVGSHSDEEKVESANQGGSWITFGTFAYSAKVKQHEIPCLEVRSSYGVRVVLIDETGTGYNGTDIPCAVYNTSCIQNGSNTTDPQLPFGLKPFTDYRWTLRYGNMLILVGNITTPESAPERPEHLQVIKRTPHAIWLTWQRPRVTNGLLRKFIICVKLLSSELRRQDRSRKLLEEEIKVTLSMNYSYEVKDLEPSSEYNVSVRGMTVEPGEPAVLNSVKTSLIVPDIGSQLKLVDDYIASTILQVIIPPADSFLAKNSSYFVVVTSDKEEVAASLTKLKMMEFILKTANVKNDGRSWIAAEIEDNPNLKEAYSGQNGVPREGGQITSACIVAMSIRTLLKGESGVHLA
ncbi:Cytokine receptor [Zootermopsis nevadensis]|uniref:Cytokine receptor n=1 Tax=Zootermopsis nevadensis TaxID=136037 RepID=A0A067R4H2_ZOONE|nr:Cytokine receptor [Zootermopsis nevadensis]